MINPPAVDVILPTHTYNNFLVESINSLRESVGVVVRIILVDNNSGYAQELKSLLLADDIYIFEEKEGFANAMNAPLKFHINFNEYIALQNSDDISTPLRLISQINRLKETSADLCVCGQYRFDAKGKYSPFFGKPPIEPYSPLLLFFGAYGADPTWTMTANTYTRMGLRNEKIHGDLVDLELALRFFPSLEVVGVGAQLYGYRSHKFQMSKNIAEYADFETIFDVISKYAAHYQIALPDPKGAFMLRPQNPITFIKYDFASRRAAKRLFLLLSDRLLNINYSHQCKMEMKRFLKMRKSMISVCGPILLVFLVIKRKLVRNI